MKKIVCLLISIMVFSITAFTPVLGVGCSYVSIVEADSNDTLTNQEKSELAFSTYVNYRSGWFTSNSNASVIALLRIYIDEYFVSDANTTDIKSYSDFVNEITVGTNSNGNWYVKLSDDGITFLDHLCKWLLGKDKFPNLYSGGSWGASPDSNDVIYSGHIIGGNLVYYYDYAFNSNYQQNFRNENMNPSLLTKGNYIDLNGQQAHDLMHNKYPSLSFIYDRNDRDLLEWNNARYPETGYLTAQFHSNFTLEYTFKVNYNQYNYTPLLYVSYLDNGNETNVTLNQYYINNGVYSGVGEFCNIMFKGNNTTVYSGILFHNFNNNKYSLHVLNEADIANENNLASVNLVTNNFEKEDIADGNEKEFIPMHNTDQGSSTYYNYYNNSTWNTEKSFYTTYITNYRQNHTIIESPTQPDPEPEQPGGETPPWDNSGSSGTITPDGNGGYDLSLPDITLPDLDINWSISGLTQKFPFSIPFDLMAFFTVLNAEPETPKLEGTIDLGIVDWEIDWDLHAFDNLAALLRNLEFIGFCIALILITRNIIKG